MEKLGDGFHGEGLVFPLMRLPVPRRWIELGAAGLAVTFAVRHGSILVPDRLDGNSPWFARPGMTARENNAERPCRILCIEVNMGSMTVEPTSQW